MLGAWLGQDQLYMVQELLSTDLWHALNEPSMLLVYAGRTGAHGICLLLVSCLVPGVPPSRGATGLQKMTPLGVW